MELQTGTLLVAAPDQVDRALERTVVLLAEHGEDGSLGLVINRPSHRRLDTIVADVCDIPDTRILSDVPVLHGGPHRPDSGWLVFDVRGENKPVEPHLALTDELALTASPQVLVSLLSAQKIPQFLFALGYLAWQPGELELQVACTHWFVLPADASLVFDVPLERRWESALASHLGIPPGWGPPVPWAET
ncbi:MAG: YqgE/AlgH family protein [Myxococcota bacterium]